MGAFFMRMTVADCVALCVLVALFVGAAAFGIARRFSTNYTAARLSEAKPPSVSDKIVGRYWPHRHASSRSLRLTAAQ